MTKSKANVEQSQPVTTEENKKKCFVIMPIADHSDYEPGHFDRVYEFLIKPACIKAGYEPHRADDSKASHMIMFDILKKIMDSDMAICDLSSKNANVFYELGLRQAFNKKTILITDGRDKPPFDIAGFRYVPYTSTLRVDSVRSEIDMISEMLYETENAPEDDVNSIVKLLKIKPANVETVNLNESESIIFNMFNKLQAQIEKLTPVNENNIIQPQPRRTPPISPLIITLEDALKKLHPETLKNITFKYQDREIGHFLHQSEGYLYFQNGARKLRFSKNEEIMNEIRIDQHWYF